MTNKQIHNYLLKQLKFICEKEYLSVPKLKRDNRIHGGRYWFNADIICYNLKKIGKNKADLLKTILHELGHHLFQHAGEISSIENEYHAESFACYCMYTYYPEFFEQYKQIILSRLDWLRTDWPIHYKAFKQVCEENVITDVITTDNKD